MPNEKRARDIVDRLKKNSEHLPMNSPAINGCIQDIVKLFDDLVPPREETHADEIEAAAEAAAEPAQDEQAETGTDAAPEAGAAEGGDPAEPDAGMTTENSPT